MTATAAQTTGGVPRARRRIGVGVIGFGWLGQAHSRSLLRIPTLFGDRFVVLNRGRMLGAWDKGGIGRDELVRMMAGGAELEQLTHELERGPVTA